MVDKSTYRHEWVNRPTPDGLEGRDEPGRAGTIKKFTFLSCPIIYLPRQIENFFTVVCQKSKGENSKSNSTHSVKEESSEAMFAYTPNTPGLIHLNETPQLHSTTTW